MKESKDFFLYIWFQEPINISRYFVQIIQLIDLRNKKSYVIKCIFDEITSNIKYISYSEDYQNLDYYLFNFNNRLEFDKTHDTYSLDPNSENLLNTEFTIKKFVDPMISDLIKYYNKSDLVYQIFFDNPMLEESEFKYFVENINKAEILNYSTTL